MNTIYDVDYFIKKFEAIENNKWIGWTCLGNGYNLRKEQTCALGFCGGYAEFSEESNSLIEIFSHYFKINNFDIPGDVNAIVYKINDNKNLVNLPTPKQRVLSVLYKMKELKYKETNQPIIKEKTVYVTISESLKDMAKENLIEEIKN